MIAAQVTIVDRNKKDFLNLLDALEHDKATHVDIGVHPVSGEEMIMIATTHEFGATINHPGGQPFYIVDPTNDKWRSKMFTPKGKLNKRGKSVSAASAVLSDGSMMVFLPKGKKGMGVTKPHEIVIPARPFISTTMDAKEQEIQQRIEQLTDQLFEGKTTPNKILTDLGIRMERAIKRTIRVLRTPPNAPSTIMKKGSSNPLIDTGAMVQSIRYEVKDKRNQTLAGSPVVK